MRKVPTLITLAAVAASAVAVSAGAQDAERTLELAVAETRCDTVDAGRRGESIGDQTFCRGTLRVAGQSQRRGVRWTCTFLGTERRGDACTASAAVPGGTLEFAGPLSHTAPASEWAVIGGTGELAGAAGVARLRQRSQTRVDVQVSLLP